MGTEFVASHVWRVVRHDKLASRLAMLNSFIPNLVWLPSQIAKLSDREASPLQLVLQSMSYSIYRDAPVIDHLAPLAQESWDLIPDPDFALDIDRAALNWFVPTPRFRTMRANRLQTVTTAFEALARGEPPAGKVIASRYTSGLADLDADTCAAMLAYLHRFQAPPKDTPSPDPKPQP